MKVDGSYATREDTEPRHLSSHYGSSLNWSQGQADLLRRAARCTPLWGASGKTAFYERGLFTQAQRGQILNLLLSTYAAAMERYKELERSRDDLERANTKLNEANRDLEAFAYSASHDLRAPLRHISGYSAMLMEDTAGQLPAKALRYLQEITGAARRMAQLIQDLLEFSRADRAAMKQGSVDGNALVHACIAELAAETVNRRIEWKLAQLPAVTGDAAMLKQVFVNLLGNAVKYTQGRDSALIEVGSVGASAHEAILFVRDNGAGFDMKYAEKLFHAFQRLHTADEFEGSGIGLATVSRIVARHGGRVWAKAAPNRGLPSTSASGEPSPRLENSRQAGG